ncbi:hypothetical protein B4Q13_15225 [Lacticaseibacillus rhamnosus]
MRYAILELCMDAKRLEAMPADEFVARFVGLDRGLKRLALSKRRAELLRLGDDASRARPVLAAYTPGPLALVTATSMTAALIT